MSEEKRCCPVDTTASKSTYVPQGDDVYITGPLDAKAGVVVVSDIFGMLPNSKRLTDDLGKAGYLVAMPDFFGADAWDANNFPPASFEDPAWLKFYKLISDLDLHRPKALRAVAMLRKMGCEKIGIVGMCWGALLTLDLSSSKSVEAAAAIHPAFLTPEIVGAARTPLCLLPSIEETGYEEIEKVFQALPVEPKVYKHYDTIHHGFLGARFDFDNCTEVEMRDRTEAQNKVMDFFKAALLS